MWYPSPLYGVLPTLLFGYIQPNGRMESLDGRTAVMFGAPGLVVAQKPVGGFAFTHLQKYSRFGFLVTWPFCIHVYFQFKKQAGSDAQNWVPGTERVFYARSPGWRMDTTIPGMVWTYGYCGFHWD